jgi:ZIP family zinc transporter
MATNYLVGSGNHYTIFRRIGCWSSFGGVAAGTEASIAGAITLAIGIGIQNFPEGIAVAMPLRRMGMSRSKSFMYGQGSALVEPVAAVLGALVTFSTNLPYALAFAAGAMILWW